MTLGVMAGFAMGIALLAAVVTKTQLFTVTVAGYSMEPGLRADEKVLCTRIWPKAWLKPGAIAVIRGFGGVTPDPSIVDIVDALLIKRITHGPGDTVVVSDSDVDKVPACYHSWTTRLIRSSRRPEWTLTLTAKEVFVMSDHRDSGLDSRAFGPVPAAAVVGLVVRRLSSGSGNGATIR